MKLLKSRNMKGRKILGTILAVSVISGSYGTIYAADIQQPVEEEIKNKASVIDKKTKALEAINNGQATVENYSELGIILEEIASNNIEFINQQVLLYKAQSEKDLVETDIILIIKQSTEKLEILFNNINSGLATVDDYNNLMIDGVDEGNLNIINNYLKDKEYELTIKIQEDVDEMNRTTALINNGEAMEEDYSLLGISLEEIASNNLSFINKKIIERNNVSILTGDEIAQIIDEITEYLSAIIDHINEGVATVEEYKELDIFGVNKRNIGFINNHIQHEEVIEYIQSQVETIVRVADDILQGEGTIEDYDFLDIALSSEAANNLEFINLGLVDVVSYEDLDNLQELINERTYYLCYLLGSIQDGTAGVSEYEELGIQGVDEENIDEVNEYLMGDEYIEICHIQEKVNKFLDN